MYNHVIDVANLIVSMMLAQGGAPRDTYNMLNTIGYVVYDDSTIDLFIGGDYAPYAPYTNEPWINRPGTNPNEGWLDSILEQVSIILAQENKGVVISSV